LTVPTATIAAVARYKAMKLSQVLRLWARGRQRNVARDEVTGLPLQAAALPWRRSATGGVEYLLVTSRNTARWIVPKGWPMPRKSLAESAEQEAYEEAGVRGRIWKHELGRFGYMKRDGAIGSLPFTLLLFPLEVEQMLDEWPEQDERLRRWFSGDETREALQSQELANLIREFEAALAAGR
jgi:8-oxo-dGTP pyrophosphatase MutT (NUDIX family)